MKMDLALNNLYAIKQNQPTNQPTNSAGLYIKFPEGSLFSSYYTEV